MTIMRFLHIKGLDLNLVEPLYALLAERHVSRAAHRCSMSQPTMSRALDRLRSALDDELLVRSGGAYERTPRGDRLLVDLQALLPRLDTALRGSRFEPATSTHHYQIATTDYAASILIPMLLERIATAAPHARVDVVPWNDRSFDGLEAGRIHLAIIGAKSPDPFESEPLFSDQFVCVVAENHPLRSKRVTLKQYLEYGHAVVAVGRNGGQPWIDHALAASGFTRRVVYRSPYQLSAMLASSHGTMICTTARRLATQLATVASVRLLAAPRELPEIVYRMTWHRRLRDDPAQNWLRQEIRYVAKGLHMNEKTRRPEPALSTSCDRPS